jgi:RNA polymerase sigma-70 factor (ECF subfamily)
MSQFPFSVPTRATLLVRLKDREDQESWQEFYDIYWRMIYGMALRSGLPEAEAQDILQETVIKVAEKMPGFNYDPKLGSFKGWLLKIARRRIIDALRKLRRERVHLVPGTDHGPGTATLERIPDPASLDFDAIWDQQWKEGLYEAALDRIRRRVPPKQFQLFDCYVRKQWPADKVAQVMGVSVSQVHMAKHRVSKILEREVHDLETRSGP